MKIIKLFDLENDGKLNMAVDGRYLYIRCKNDVQKYNIADMSLVSKNTIFKKAGKARGLEIFGDKIFLYDFLDLYILNKFDLHVIDVIRLGENLSSDVCGTMWFDSPNVYGKIRNGWIYELNIESKEFVKNKIADSSFWAHNVFDNKVYIGTYKGELIETDKTNLHINQIIQLCRKNIYDIIIHNGLLYTVSQDTTLKAIDSVSFEIIHNIRKAVRGMAKILGIFDNKLILYDWGQIALWNIQAMQLIEKFDFPHGDNGGAIMFAEGKLYGGDKSSLYCCDFTAV